MTDIEKQKLNEKFKEIKQNGLTGFQFDCLANKPDVVCYLYIDKKCPTCGDVLPIVIQGNVEKSEIGAFYSAIEKLIDSEQGGKE